MFIQYWHFALSGEKIPDHFGSRKCKSLEILKFSIYWVGRGCFQRVGSLVNPEDDYLPYPSENTGNTRVAILRLMARSHCTETGPEQAQGTGLVQQETMGFSLNRAELSLNSVNSANSENLRNH